MCKGLMMVRTGGYILSSLMLIVLSIDRWLHPLLPYAHRSQCGQVHHCQHRQHHHLPQIHDTSPHKNSSSIGMIIALSSCYRYISISNPLSSLNNVRQRRRARSSTFLSFIFLLLPGKVIIFNIFIILSIPKGSTTQIHAGGIWALPVRGGGLNPCPDGLG